MPSAYDLDQVRHANATGRVPVVFVHDPWLLAESWEPWAEVFGQAGFVPLIPAWPEDGGTAAPAAHFAALIGGLARRPALVGHAAGGLVAQILAGRGLACACVAISPAPFRGALTYGRFRHAVANAVGEEEARRLYETYAVQAAGDPWGLDGTAPDRGPLLLVAGEMDRTVPWAAAHASYLWQARNRHHRTEIVELPGRGHSMTVDSGWREVCGTALTFVERFVDP